jgi:hypothetical protein
MQYIEDPIQHVLETSGLLNAEDGQQDGKTNTLDKKLGKERREEIDMAAPDGPQQWNDPVKDKAMAEMVAQRNAGLKPKDANVTADEAKQNRKQKRSE